MKDGKPWYKSLTVMGVVTSAVGIVLSPEVSGILKELPVDTAERAAAIIRWVGLGASLLGIRRAMPGRESLNVGGTLPGVPSDPQNWAYTFNAQGVNPYGETMGDVWAREQEMARVAREREQELLGPHRTKESPWDATGKRRDGSAGK